MRAFEIEGRVDALVMIFVRGLITDSGLISYIPSIFKLNFGHKV